MIVRARRAGSTLAIGAIVMLVAMATVPGEAVAAVGDLLRTVTVGVEADCSAFNPGIGTSVAIVQGPKVGLPQFPVLLVTSCLASGGSKSVKEKRATLYLLNPLNGNVVKTIQTKLSGSAFAPGDGWAQLVMAANKGVLYGCGTDGGLYTIDYISSPTDAVPDGTVTQKSKPLLATSCAGLAWDPSNNSVYQSIGGTIFHFNPEGGAVPGNPAPPASFSAPSGCTVSGLSVVGGVLLVACSGGGTVKRLDKVNGGVLAADPTLTFAAPALSDLECDPVTYGNPPFVVDGVLGETVAVWSKNAVADQVIAYRAPAGMCALPPTATVLAPAACPNDPKYVNADGSPKDSDGDGLWDCWEDGARWVAIDGKPGISFNNDGNRDLILCVTVDSDGNGTADKEECADPNRKDLFVEIDWMQNADGTKSHKPDPVALFNVRQAFAGAPVDVPNGIALHFLVNEATPHADLLSLQPCTDPPSAGAVTFDERKAAWFGTAAERNNAQTMNAKLMSFRYMLFAHNLIGTNSSGCGEIAGDDSAITLAAFGLLRPDGDRNGTTDQQAGTVMHELGHNLGLQHGGGDGVNCKPNYLSVMNYMFQYPDFVSDRPLDFSPAALGTLTEGTNVLEGNGLGAFAQFPFLNGETTLHSAPGFVTALKAKLGDHIEPLPTGNVVDYGQGVDWNNNGSSADSLLLPDVNKIGQAGCTGEGTVLVGYNDWANLKYNARASIDFGSGVPVGEQDKDAAQEQASFDLTDSDHNGIRDAFGCGSNTIPCAIDIKPGENPAVLSKGNEANLKVRIIGICSEAGNPKGCTLIFDPTTQVLRSTLTLNGWGVKVNQGGTQGTCNNVESTNGRKDLDCQFPAAALPLGTNYGVLEGKAVIPGNPNPQTFRARDIVTVTK